MIAQELLRELDSHDTFQEWCLGDDIHWMGKELESTRKFISMLEDRMEVMESAYITPGFN